jgi:hypothetical protein
MKRPLSDMRLLGPFVNYSDSKQPAEDFYVEQLSSKGAENIKTKYLGDLLIIDFLTIGDEPDKEFSSSIEVSGEGIGSCLLRLPHVVGGVSEWDKMSDDIARVIGRTTDINPYSGLLKRERGRMGIVTSDGVIIRPNDGFNDPDNEVLTPHIVFEATDMSGGTPTIPASFNEIAETVEELNEMWDALYSDVVETVETDNVI